MRPFCLPLLAIIPAVAVAQAQTCPAHFQPPLQMPQSPSPLALRDVLALKQLPHGDLIVAGGGSGQLIHRLSAATRSWSEVGLAFPTSSDGRVIALETDLQGRLYAAGESFRMASGINAPQGPLARYDPQTNSWAPLPGMPQTTNTWALFCLTRTANGEMIAAGAMTFIGTDGTRGSAVRFNPVTESWTIIPTGTSSQPIMSVLELPSGDLVVAGAVQRIGTATSNYVALYETATNTWRSMGSGFNAPGVQTLRLLPGGDVLALGNFTTADGASARRVARYSFTTNAWSPLGNGLSADSNSGSVTDAYVLPNGDIIATGWFGVGSTWGIARFDTALQQWLEVPGMYYFSEKLTQLQSGELAIGCYRRGFGPATVAIYNLGFSGDFNNDGGSGTDQDIEDFFACLAGNCCITCPSSGDVNGDGDVGTDQDIEAFFRVLAGGGC